MWRRRQKEQAVKFPSLVTMKPVVLGWVCAGALVTAACGDNAAAPTAPGTTLTVSTASATGPSTPALAVAATFPRSGEVHLTKECPEYTGLAGSFCTITASNLKEIEIGSRVIYASAATPTAVDSDVVIDPPGPGNNRAFGHVHLDRITRTGVLTLSGGTGKFTWFHAVVDISFVVRPVWHLDGTYSFDPRD
jgi:hypothetical protein